MRGTNGLAKIIEASPKFNSTIYANTEIALREVERARLRLDEKDQSNWFETTFVPPLNEKYKEPIQTVIWAKFVASKAWLFKNRPAFSVYLTHAPKGTRVRIQLIGLNEVSRQLLTSPQATSREWITLDTSPNNEGVWFREKGDEETEDTWEIGLQPLWDIDQLASITKPEHINLGVDVSYGDGTNDDRHQVSVKIIPVQSVELDYPLRLGFAGLVDGGHPWVAKILNNINQSAMAKNAPMVVGVGADPEGVFFGVFMLWRELRARGLRYQSSAGTSDKNAVQAVRSIEDSLAEKNANCIDGSVLFCSFFERMSIACYMFLPPGHALVAFHDTENVWELETTGLGSNDECSKEFRASVEKKFPRLKKLVSTFKAEDARDFSSYLAALESGSQTVGAEFKKAMSGDAESKLPSVSELLQMLSDKEVTEEQRMRAFRLIQTQFVSLYSLRDARAAGIEPVPIPKKFKSELPPQPARTR